VLLRDATILTMVIMMTTMTECQNKGYDEDDNDDSSDEDVVYVVYMALRMMTVIKTTMTSNDFQENATYAEGVRSFRTHDVTAPVTVAPSPTFAETLRT
jgi:hypothetical protein